MLSQVSAEVRKKNTSRRKRARKAVSESSSKRPKSRQFVENDEGKNRRLLLLSLSLLSLNLARLLPPPPPPRNPSPSLHPSPLQVPSTPLKVTLTNGNVVITPPVKNFTAIDPTTNATAYPVPTWARLTAKEKTASTQGQALLNATAYPFVYGYVPTSGLKNTTNYTLAAVGAVGTAVNATATALNFTSPVAGLGSDLAQAINNAIKVRLGFRLFCLVSFLLLHFVKLERKRERERGREKGNDGTTHLSRPLRQIKKCNENRRPTPPTT